MSRVTFDVDKFKHQINGMLAISTCSKEHREGLITALEQVLHGSGNYHGFNYLDIRQIPEGCKPGINLDPDGSGMPHRNYDLRFKDTDSSRVRYF